MIDDRFRKAFLIVLVVAISAAFVYMIRTFLLTILLAAIFAAVVYPLYQELLAHLRGKRALASAATIVLMLVLVIAPLVMLGGVVGREAARVAENVRPWIEARIAQPDLLDETLRRVPYLGPFRAELMNRGAELVGNVGRFFANALSAATKETVLFFFQFFIMLYTMFFFLMDGPHLLRSMLSYVPIAAADKQRMVDKFISVTRATLKGTILIGITQGTLSGIAFWVVGIDGAIFWTVLMILLSAIPGVGGALVWVPAVILLLAQRHVAEAVGLALFCALVVGSIDNVMRPRLVGRDTKMHDLLVLFSTLGGLLVFGPSGFIVGPILTAMFITVWEMFGVAFRDVLQDGVVPPSVS